MIPLWLRLAAMTESCWNILRRSASAIWESNHRLTLHKSPPIKAFARYYDILTKIWHAKSWPSMDRRMQFWVPTCFFTFLIFIPLWEGLKFLFSPGAYSCFEIRIFSLYSQRG